MMRLWLIGMSLILALGLDVLWHHDEHAVFWWHRVPAFAVVYGFVGCLALVLGAQWLGRTWLERDVDADREEDQPCP
jgi:hypothetical protein